MSKILKERKPERTHSLRQEGRGHVDAAPAGSQLPVLLTALLLLYGFQAALALGLGTAAGGLAKCTRQARQLDLLHVF